MTSDVEVITFTVDVDSLGIRRIYADHFPARIEISEEFLRSADPSYVSRRFGERDANTIRFTVANGAATYGIVEHDADRGVYVCEHLAGEVRQ